jgi:hypothetical protein
MMISVVPAFVGMLALALLPREGYLWTRWGMFLITIFGNIAGPRKTPLTHFVRSSKSMLTIQLSGHYFHPMSPVERRSRSQEPSYSLPTARGTASEPKFSKPKMLLDISPLL